MATQLSAISFVSAPAFVGLRKGGGMQWLTFEFGVPLAMIAIMIGIAPLLHRAGVVSVYGFLEKRFGPSSRLILSSLFVFSRSFGTGVGIYTIGLILSSLIGVEFWQTMLVLGIVTIAYSLEGGMKAIVYSEVAQMIIKFLGILVIMFAALHYMGGWEEFTTHLDRSRLRVIDLSNFGFDGREYGFWPMMIGGVFLYASYYGTDQTQAQRILSARDEGVVRRLLMFNGLFRFPVTLSYCLGGLILGTFALTNTEFAARIPANKPDLMIPTFISGYLPHGVIGIIVVALIAAWMSSYSSTLNSLTAVTMEDFIKRRITIPENKYIFYSKAVALAWGAVTMGFGFFSGKIASTAIEAINKIGSLFYGPILAIFLLAGVRFVKPLAANVGVIVGVMVNLILWLFFKNVFWFWWNAIGGITTLSVGMMLSVILPGETIPLPASVQIRRIFPWREVSVLLIFFGCILTFCALLPRLL
jgi:SSS family transporter